MNQVESVIKFETCPGKNENIIVITQQILFVFFKEKREDFRLIFVIASLLDSVYIKFHSGSVHYNLIKNKLIWLKIDGTIYTFLLALFRTGSKVYDSG